MDALPENLSKAIDQSPFIPILSRDDLDGLMAQAADMVAERFPAISVPFRTKQADIALQNIKDRHPNLLVGAGTILTPRHLEAALSVGADFIISPVATSSLVDALKGVNVPAILGSATATEAQKLADRGYLFQNFFPAAYAGGHEILETFYGPMPHVKFMPTGALHRKDVLQYLALPNVFAVSGSYMTQV